MTELRGALCHVCGRRVTEHRGAVRTYDRGSPDQLIICGACLGPRDFDSFSAGWFAGRESLRRAMPITLAAALGALNELPDEEISVLGDKAIETVAGLPPLTDRQDERFAWLSCRGDQRERGLVLVGMTMGIELLRSLTERQR